MQPLKITLRAALVSLAAALAFTPPAGAAILHVTGDSGNCTSQQLGCSLATALAASHSGDAIWVHAGVHGINAAVFDSTSGVTIQGAPDEPRPVLAISGAGSGLRLTHGTGLSGVDVVSTADIAVEALGGLIERVRISAHGSSTAAVQLGDGAILRNSTVSASGADAVGVLVSTGGALTQLRGASVLATGGGGSALLVSPTGSTSSLRAVNSILRGYGGALDVRAVSSALETATVVLDHSATSASGHQASGPGSAIDNSRSPLTADPLFADRGNLDLRQTGTSPTIDAGTADLDGDGDVDADDSAAAGPTDLDGTPRQLGLPDIGSDEREMPPIVLSAKPIVTDGRLALRVIVQPRGLDTVVTAEWSTGTENATVATKAGAAGNVPVAVDLELGELPAGVQIAIRARASNSAGSDISDDASFDVPDAVSTTTTTTTTAPAAAPTSPAPITGGLPTLVSTKLRAHWGIFQVKLRCAHTVSCRGVILLTRLGKTSRWEDFSLGAGASQTFTLTLTSAQTRKLRAAGTHGVRALLEVRSAQMGSTFTAVRLTAGGAVKKP